VKIRVNDIPYLISKCFPKDSLIVLQCNEIGFFHSFSQPVIYQQGTQNGGGYKSLEQINKPMLQAQTLDMVGDTFK